MRKKIDIPDDQFLKIVTENTYVEAAKILGVSFSYCWMRASNLGVRKQPGRKKGSAKLKFKGE